MGVVISLDGNAASRQVVETAQSLYIANMQTDSRLDSAMRHEAQRRGTVSLLLVPLVIGERVIGTLGLDATEERAFSAGEIALAENAAATGSQALERARLVEELEQELAERRRAQEELAAANKELAEASRLKSHFLANMSHELRTPLNSILGYTDMITQGFYGPVTEKQLDRLEKVSRNGRMLLQLINDILDLSKIEAGRMKLELAPADISKLVEECLLAMETLANHKGLTLARDLQPLPPLLVDRGRLLQVLTNLVGNAIKFTASGAVTVHACPPGDAGFVELPSDVTLAGREWGMICVEDTGIGIAPEDHDVIFDEFRQVDSSSTRKFEGTGLGLAISRKLVNMMGGHIWVESRPGEGSRFFVLLPVAEEGKVPAR